MLIAIGVTVADRRAGPGRGLIGAVAGNGLVLPVVAMTVSLALLLPLAVAMAAADAIAGEAACRHPARAAARPGRPAAAGGDEGVRRAGGGGRPRCSRWPSSGCWPGCWWSAGPDGQLVTLSGTTLGLGEALGRIALVAVWTVGQLAAVGAVALAVSAWTEHPLVVLAAVLGGLIVFGVLGAIPTLDWLQPYLLTSGWSAGVDALRDPLPLAGMRDATWRALCYLAVGIAATIAQDAAPRRLTGAAGARRARDVAAGFLKTRFGARMSAMPALLDDAAIDTALKDLPGWRREGDALVLTAELPTFPVAIGVVARVAEIAESRDHHPDIDIRWRTLTFRCSTHSEGGITQRDVDLAAAISEQVEAQA